MNSVEKEKVWIPLKGNLVRSLLWHGDDLVDWAGGGTRFKLDGSTIRAGIYWAYRFDRAVSSCDGRYQIIYETLGTKGLVLCNNKCVREINRSFYHAYVYEYPLVIFHLPDGRVAIAHCPNDYNKIEIEEIETGQKLTIREGEAADFFHSRLQVSPDGEYLLSSGWVWHPLDAVQLFRVRDVLQNPTVLDKSAHLELPEELFEVHAAAFQSNDSIIMVGNNGGEPGEEGPFLIQYNLREGRVNLKTGMQEVAGTLMPVNSEYVMGFFEHPKLIEIASGKVVQSWPELNSGKQNSSIILDREMLPQLALDPARKRFAVADANGITVIQLK
jgi:hypothetical protein